jgi:glyoxylase-like metal-dependent hydrolase (beta-lactamase superfamily II)
MSREEAIKESELGILGVFRIPIPIPFHQAGGPVNAYVIEEERGFLLFDPGLGLDNAQAALAEGLARTGHRFQDINRIVLSHGHIDHFGSAAWAMEQAGKTIPVLINSADAGKILESGVEWPELLAINSWYLSILGMPSQVQEAMVSILKKNPGLGRRLAEVSPLLPGDRFQCKHVTLEVLHMPGHTPGLSCLYDREHRILFSGDHLLERVSPNPLIELGSAGEPVSYKALVTYFKSLERVRVLAIDLVLPGHADPFGGHQRVIDSLHSFYQRRQAKLLDILKNSPLTPFEIMNKLFSSDSGFELFLMLSETLGNLEILEEKGAVERVADGELIRFHIVNR